MQQKMERENLPRKSIREWFNSISHSSLIIFLPFFRFSCVIVSLLGSFCPKIEMMILLMVLWIELNYLVKKVLERCDKNIPQTPVRFLQC